MIINDKWMAEENYKTYPKDKWCDCDYVAAWIESMEYKPMTSIENLVEMILSYYTSYLTHNNTDFYIDTKKESENGLMISIEDVSCFVKESGGLSEFDYYC